MMSVDRRIFATCDNYERTSIAKVFTSDCACFITILAITINRIMI